ncbi:MAG: hypothetical protein Q8K29_13495 [Polaromonas sp.]|nr:hypothetical protein [Polaromonas sp.]
MQPFFARKNRGQYKGKVLYPHQHQDGTYVATTSKFSVDYVRVNNVDELAALVRAGYGARMSNPEIPQAPSFISPSSITFATKEEPLAQLKRFLTTFAEVDQLDSETVANRRKEQVFLRSFLLHGESAGNCCFCGRMLPEELLVAAHIKMRAVCTREEKLDFNNIAALMCVLGCDALFGKGYVYVDEGSIRLNAKRARTLDVDTATQTLLGRKVSNWVSSKKYYLWHSEEFGAKGGNVNAFPGNS